MKKLILFDIDGTIVTEGYQGRIIPDSFYETLHALQEKGHLCFINTGRAFSEVGEEIRSLGLMGISADVVLIFFITMKNFLRKHFLIHWAMILSRPLNRHS